MDLAQKIAEYTPSQSALDLVTRTKIALLVGISGAGKDTIKKELLKSNDFRDIISHTTRPPRRNNGVAEVPDVDYHFIDIPVATTMVDTQLFIEAKLVHGTVYGTSVAEVQAAHDEKKIAITDVDVQGVDEYKELSRSVIAMFVLPPTYEVWRERLSKRYETREAFEAEWPKRRDSAIKELTHALEVPYYHFIVNDDLSRAVMAASEIAHKPDVFHRKDDEARLMARDLLVAIQATV